MHGTDDRCSADSLRLMSVRMMKNSEGEEGVGRAVVPCP